MRILGGPTSRASGILASGPALSRGLEGSGTGRATGGVATTPAKRRSARPARGQRPPWGVPLPAARGSRQPSCARGGAEPSSQGPGRAVATGPPLPGTPLPGWRLEVPAPAPRWGEVPARTDFWTHGAEGGTQPGSTAPASSGCCSEKGN